MTKHQHVESGDGAALTRQQWLQNNTEKGKDISLSTSTKSAVFFGGGVAKVLCLRIVKTKCCPHFLIPSQVFESDGPDELVLYLFAA